MGRRWPILLRGLLAVLLLVALVAGIPALLVREVGWPLPTVIPSWEQIAHTLTTGAIEDATIIKALAVILWLTWANFAVGIVLEAVALARGRAAHRVAGIRSAQRLAARLLATTSIAVATLSRPATMPTADPGELRLAVSAALASQPPDPIDLTAGTVLVASSSTDGSPHGWPVSPPDAPPSAGPTGSARTYDVQRGDTLWDIAERFLGDGLRWREIRDLNVGRPQPDGASISPDGEELRTGWSLLLPARAPATTRPAAAAPTTDAQASVTVEPGDTLWDLADQHLGDPHRWPEVYDENRDVRQPDGRRLTDPDLIQPGWVLELPRDVGDVAEPPIDQDGDPTTGNDIPEADELPRVGEEATADLQQELAGGGRSPKGHADASVVSPPSAEPLPTPRASGEPARDQAPSPLAEASDDEAAIVPVLAAGALAAGLLLTLHRLRRARMRRREPQHRIPLPADDDLRAEQVLRMLADEETAEFVDLALRELAGPYAPHRPMPPIHLVTYGTDDVAVHLTAASNPPPDTWERHDDGLTWSRTRPTGLAEFDEHRGTPARVPALVTVGTLAGGRVGMINLGESGCLHLDGERDEANRLLAVWALELATTPRADALDVVAVGLADLPSGLERLTVIGDHEQLRDLLNRPHANGHSNVPRTVVLAADLPPDLAVLLRTTSELRPDIVVATTDLQPRSGSRVLHLQGDGRARLLPEDVTFELMAASEMAVPTTTRLLEQALHDPDQLVPIPDLPDDEPQVTAGGDAGSADGDVAPEPSVEVRVLGPVEIVGAAEPFRTNKTIELIVYLALHRSGADTDTLMEALWPLQEPRAARLYTEASRARKALGTAGDGSPHLPDAELGRYRLASSVGLDYERFVASIDAARRNPDTAVAHLRDALSLVGGVPLSATATEYAWATNHVYQLTQEVVDAAHELARICLEAKQYDDAIWAAERGLTADPLAEVLVRDLMEAVTATGNSTRAHAAMARLRRLITEDGDANDADDWLHPETLSAFERLTRRVEA